jgi:tetratricopeptide (TPR) repeat protein
MDRPYSGYASNSANTDRKEVMTALALASDAEIATLIAALESGTSDDVTALDTLLLSFPDDPRLHFMRGSVLAGQKDPIAAHAAMSRAVELAPDFALARYQLGFFELTSGEVERALSTWGPLLMRNGEDYLRVFVEGMTLMIRDEFNAAIERFEKGLSLNRENEPLNGDIRLLLGEVLKLTEGERRSDDEELSATSLLLGQFGAGSRSIN